MPPPTTLLILTNKALNRPCGRECAEWAMAMLMEGHEGKNLATLASMRRYDNPFEMATLRDRALREVGAEELEGTEAILAYAAETVRRGLDGTIDLFVMLREMFILYRDSDRLPELLDFYLLYLAHGDLQSNDHQEYWPVATRENIVDIIRERARRFVNDGGTNPSQ